MNRFITTITIVHEAESESTAKSDADTMKRQVRQILIDSHVRQEIGPVRAVTVYQTKQMV